MFFNNQGLHDTKGQSIFINEDFYKEEISVRQIKCCLRNSLWSQPEI